MATVSCSQCGKHDSLLNMRTCICFEHSFCSEEHFNQHAHSKVVDEIHAQDVNIGPNIRRLFKKGKFVEALTAYRAVFIEWRNAIILDTSGNISEPTDTKLIDIMLTNAIEKFTTQVSNSRKDNFAKQLRNVFNNLKEAFRRWPVDEERIYGETQQTLLLNASGELLRKFKEENRLSLSQTSKAIENAWITFLMAVLDYGYIATEDQSIILHNRFNRIVEPISRILGGGKDEPIN